MEVEGVYLAKAAAYLAAAFVMAVGGIAPAYGQGLIGATACENIGKHPESGDKIRLAMIFAMAIVESVAVYALIVALILLFKG